MRESRLLFIAYINDLPLHVCTNATVSMYAGDTAMYTTCKNANELKNVLNNDLCNVSNWPARNKLSLNVTKTDLIIIGSKQRLSQINEGELNVHNYTSMKQNLRDSRLVNKSGLSLMKICLEMNMLIKW